MSYAELDAAADRLAYGLRRLGIGKGDRIVVHLPNIVEFAAISFALWRLGALPVYALPAHREAEIAYFVAHTEAVAYIAPESFAGFDFTVLAKAAREAAPSLRHVLLLGEGGDADLRQCSPPPSMPTKRGRRPTPTRRRPPTSPSSSSPAGPPACPSSSPAPTTTTPTTSGPAPRCAGLGPGDGLPGRPARRPQLPAGLPRDPGHVLRRGAGGHGLEPEAGGRLRRHRGAAGDRHRAGSRRWPSAGWNHPSADRFDLSSLRLLQVGGARLNPEVGPPGRTRAGLPLQQVFGMGEGLLNYTRLDDPDDVVDRDPGPAPLAGRRGAGGRRRRPDLSPTASRASCSPAGPTPSGATTGPKSTTPGPSPPDGFYRTGDVVRSRCGRATSPSRAG